MYDDYGFDEFDGLRESSHPLTRADIQREVVHTLEAIQQANAPSEPAPDAC